VPAARISRRSWLISSELPDTDSVLNAKTGALRSSKPQPDRPTRRCGEAEKKAAARQRGIALCSCFCRSFK
jgi:hypothetical protein